MNKQYTEDGLLWTSSYNPPYNATKYYYYKYFINTEFLYLNRSAKVSSIEHFNEILPPIKEALKRQVDKDFYGEYTNFKGKEVHANIILKKFVYSLVYQTLEGDRFKPIDIDYDKTHDEYSIGVSYKGSSYMNYHDNWTRAAKNCFNNSYKIQSTFCYNTKKYVNTYKPYTPTRIWYITVDKVLDHYCF
jgi:hypothetical protein